VTWAVTGVWVWIHAALWIGEQGSWLGDWNAWCDRWSLRPDVLEDWWATRHRGGSTASFWGDIAVPLVSYSAVHRGPLHLVGNVLFFHVFGGRLERRLGSLGFAAWCAVAAAVAGCAGAIWRGWSLAAAIGWGAAPEVPPSGPIVGASGLVVACLGAYLVLYPRARVLLLVPVVVVPVFVTLPAVSVLASWAVLQVPALQEFLARGDGEPLGAAGRLSGLALGIALGVLLGVVGWFAGGRAQPAPSARATKGRAARRRPANKERS